MATTSPREGGRLRLLAVVQLAAGLWLLAAPFVLGYPRSHPHWRALVVDLVVGALVLGLSTYHLLNWESGRGATRLVLLLGMFLVVVPVFFGYNADPTLGVALRNDLVTGTVVIAGAVLGLVGSGASRGRASR